jgi:hypothetical protein
METTVGLVLVLFATRGVERHPSTKLAMQAAAIKPVVFFSQIICVLDCSVMLDQSRARTKTQQSIQTVGDTLKKIVATAPSRIGIIVARKPIEKNGRLDRYRPYSYLLAF